MKQRRYSFTLMEVLIGFSILSLILGIIFSTLYQETLLTRRIQKMESETMTKIEIQQRLDKIFANILHTDPASKDRSIYSSEDKKSIIVFFDNGIDPNPIFSGIVKGSIGLEKTSFVLQLYKDFSAKDPSRTTILKEDVKSIDFEFMMSSPIGVSTVPIWDKATNFSPRYIKINLNGEEEYVFWVNNTCEPITLKGKK